MHAEASTEPRARRGGGARAENAPRERGILFSAEMVRALLAGTKTQTRRIYRPRYPEPYEVLEDGVPFQCGEDGVYHRREEPYGVVGDRLWVRETWAAHWMYNDVSPSKCASGLAGDNYWYFADGDQGASNCGLAAGGLRGKKRAAILMPRWASRITLEVTDVRVQRLQDISEVDARAEGFSSDPMPGEVNGKPATVAFFDPVRWYANLWCQINGAESWKANPWVWAVSFRVRP